MSTSKQIGNSLERKVASVFSKALGGQWVRTPSSGGFVGGKNIVRQKTLDQDRLNLFSADIIPPKGYETIVIECKKRAKIDFRKFVDISGSKELNEWIKQVYNDNLKFEPEEKFRMIVFSPKFGGLYCCYLRNENIPLIPILNHTTYWFNTVDFGIRCFIIHELTEVNIRIIFQKQLEEYIKNNTPQMEIKNDTTTIMEK